MRVPSVLAASNNFSCGIILEEIKNQLNFDGVRSFQDSRILHECKRELVDTVALCLHIRGRIADSIMELITHFVDSLHQDRVPSIGLQARKSVFPQVFYQGHHGLPHVFGIINLSDVHRIYDILGHGFVVDSFFPSGSETGGSYIRKL